MEEKDEPVADCSSKPPPTGKSSRKRSKVDEKDGQPESASEMTVIYKTHKKSTRYCCDGYDLTRILFLFASCFLFCSWQCWKEGEVTIYLPPNKLAPKAWTQDDIKKKWVKDKFIFDDNKKPGGGRGKFIIGEYYACKGGMESHLHLFFVLLFLMGLQALALRATLNSVAVDSSRQVAGNFPTIFAKPHAALKHPLVHFAKKLPKEGTLWTR